MTSDPWRLVTLGTFCYRDQSFINRRGVGYVFTEGEVLNLTTPPPPPPPHTHTYTHTKLVEKFWYPLTKHFKTSDHPLFIYLSVRLKIKFTSSVCRLNFHQTAPHFQGNAYFIKNFDRPWCTMVSIDFVSDSQQMKLYDYVEKDFFLSDATEDHSGQNISLAESWSDRYGLLTSKTCQSSV